MVIEQDVTGPDGRTLHVYDSGGDGPALLWHHGTPQTGVPLPPLLAPARARGLRLLAYGRPGYGGSTGQPGRRVVDAAGDVAALLDARGVERCAVAGASGGGSHALACAARLPERITGVVCLAGLAPYTENFDWYAGMVAPGGLQSARGGRTARARYAETEQFNPESFTAADWAALEGDWSPLGQDAVKAGAAGPDGAIDDDVAYATPWGFDLAEVTAPVLLAQGGLDRVVPPGHADWLLRHLPRAELWLRPRDGHISILGAYPVGLDWLRAYCPL